VAGCLLAYGAQPLDLCQRSAVFVDKILKGATPATLRAERAYKFYLQVNLKTCGSSWPDALAAVPLAGG
jgi:putative ABC transport system substrate-binding protein